MSETTTPDPQGARPGGPDTWSARLRRALTRRTVVWMTLIGGAMLLISSTMTWVTASGLGATSAVQEVEISGADLVDTVTAMGLVGLAAGLAVSIAKLLGRVLIGSVLFGAAIIALLSVRAVLADTSSTAASALGEITGTTAEAQRYELSGAVWLGFAGALLLLVASLALLLLSHRWPDRQSRKYQVSGGESGSEQRVHGGSAAEHGTGTAAGPTSQARSGRDADPDEFDLWDGLSDGEDPTDSRR